MTAISQIDQQIDAIRRALMTRLHFDPGFSAGNWQRAWDRCPDLYARDVELSRQRGVAQQERDAKAHKDWQVEQRRQRRTYRASVKPCPTCGSLTIAA